MFTPEYCKGTHLREKPRKFYILTFLITHVALIFTIEKMYNTVIQVRFAHKLPMFYMLLFPGKQLQTVDIPAKRTTSCCFGGKNLDELFVTCGVQGSTEEERKEYPMTGSVFRVTGLGVRGRPSNVYEG